MKQAKQASPRLAVYFTQHKAEQYDSDSSNYRLHILHIQDEQGDKGPRNCSRGSEYRYPGTAIFEDLEMSCYMTWRNGEFSADMWETRYHGYMYVDANAAETMLKGLRKVEKIRAAFPLTPTTFGQYVALMCAGFGVKELCRETANGRTGFYSDSAWQYLPISYIQGFVDEEIARVRKSKVDMGAVREEAAA